jgi:DNA-directed RNA polymerase subunit RPC12/RpoP
MTAAATVTCPECHKTFKGRQELDGKKIRCKNCQHIFVVTLGESLKIDRGGEEPEAVRHATAAGAPAKTAPAASAAVADEERYGVEEMDLRARCPNCANPLVSDDAVVCLECGYNFLTRSVSQTQKTVEATQGDRMTWLMPGLLCVAGIFILIVFCITFCLLLPEMLGPKSILAFMDSEAVRWWTVVAALAIMWWLGRVACNRLILNPTPPEEEA